MILLDTNVISELLRPRPEPRVESWLAGQRAESLFICSVTEGELRVGVAFLASGRKREKLLAAIEAILEQDFADRILPFDSAAAIAFAEISSDRRRIGRPISQLDAQIAAIAKSRNAKLATRNVKDFQDCGVEIIDPWNT